jgi:hypothetical protein
MSLPFGGPLLASARSRLLIASIAVLALWCVVLWAILTQSKPDAAEPPKTGAASTLRIVAKSGQPAPSGGNFDRFDVAAQPIVAPVNLHGHVAFYASIARTKAVEGIFLYDGAHIAKVAAVGDPVPGGGTLSEFAKHPIPSLNDADKVAFGAAIAGARATEGIFLAAGGTLKPIALSGTDAPDILRGTLVEFDTPSLNNRDEIVFVATVRRGRDTLQVLYLYSNGKLHKLIAAGDPLPRSNEPINRIGTFDEFGVPAINNNGVVAIPAVVEHGPILGGIFMTGTQTLHLLVGAGQEAPNGAMLVRFSERVAINDDDNVVFGAKLGTGADAEGVFLATASGLVQVAAVGENAPGGGRFVSFGPWPGIGPGDMVSFVAGIDDGPGPSGLYEWRAGEFRRVAMAGDRLPDGKPLAAFALNPIAAGGPNGGVTFATMAAEVGRSGIYYFGPPPN